MHQYSMKYRDVVRRIHKMRRNTNETGSSKKVTFADNFSRVRTWLIQFLTDDGVGELITNYEGNVKEQEMVRT